MARKVTQDPAEATTVVNVADFQRTRDSVIVALATLQSSVQDLSRAYINHANTVLNPGRGGALDANLTNILTESGLIGTGGMQPHGLQIDAAAEPATGEKKKRKRAKHDPNAPKRALTPYFLYMQSARSMIAQELGEHAKPKEVADEGTRRWGEMKPEDKGVWDELYQKNLAAYRVRMAAYKAGQEVPNETEALRLVQAGKGAEIAALPEIAELEADSDEEEVEVEEESSPEPAKEPTPPPKSNKRRKVEPKASTPPKETLKAPTKSPVKSKKGKKEASPPPVAPASSKASEKKTKKSKKA